MFLMAGANRWIGYYPGNTDEYIYWQDGSYVEVTGSVPYPGKVSYASDDHSAITTSETGWFISKWGNKVLARHRWNDCPYTSSSLKYFKLNFSISGPSLVCSSGASFSVDNLPPGATISWDQSSNISRSSSQGSNPCTFVSSGSGTGWIEATISTGCGDIILPRKEITVNPDIIGRYAQGTTWKDLYTVNFITSGTTTVVSVDSEGSSAPFNWQLLPESSVVNWGSYYPDNSVIGFDIISGNQASFSVSTTNACGNTVSKQYYFVVSGGGYYMSISPNPSTFETTISIESTSVETASLDAATEEWDLEVYDQSQTLKAKKTKLKGKETDLNTSNWKEGVYVVRAKYKGEVLTEKLVVK
jgi:hypothetical protein